MNRLESCATLRVALEQVLIRDVAWMVGQYLDNDVMHTSLIIWRKTHSANLHTYQPEHENEPYRTILEWKQIEPCNLEQESQCRRRWSWQLISRWIEVDLRWVRSKLAYCEDFTRVERSVEFQLKSWRRVGIVGKRRQHIEFETVWTIHHSNQRAPYPWSSAGRPHTVPPPTCRFTWSFLIKRHHTEPLTAFRKRTDLERSDQDQIRHSKTLMCECGWIGGLDAEIGLVLAKQVFCHVLFNASHSGHPEHSSH